MAKSHGFYLQHSKETCFVAKKGNPPPLTNFGKESDVIYSERLGQSQKPIDIYELIERLVPNGKSNENENEIMCRILSRGVWPSQ